MSAKLRGAVRLDFCVDMPSSIATVEVDTDHLLAWAHGIWSLADDVTGDNIVDYLDADDFVTYLKKYNLTGQATLTPTDQHWSESDGFWDLQRSDEQ